MKIGLVLISPPPYICTGCPKKTWEFSDEFDIVVAMN